MSYPLRYAEAVEHIIRQRGHLGRLKADYGVRVCGSPTTCKIASWNDDLGPEPTEQEIFDTVAIVELAEAIRTKNANIDKRTRQLIAGGTTHGGKKFSLSLPAQHNWDAILTAVNGGILAPPITITTADDEEYTLATTADVLAFAGAALGTVKGHLDSGRAIKQQVNAATTVAEVDAIQDDR